MTNAKPVPTPMCVSTSLPVCDGEELYDPSEYRNVVGSLQYLLLTCSDIAFAVNKLSQFMHKPSTICWLEAKRVLRYLAGTYMSGIFLSRHINFLFMPIVMRIGLEIKMTTTLQGLMLCFLDNILFHGRPKSRHESLSSTEAEHWAVSAAASEVFWLYSLLYEVGVKLDNIHTIYYDNIGATYLSANPVFHSRMKHLALDYHFIRKQVQNRTLRVSHVSSKDQLADGLTKPLTRNRFGMLFTRIGITTRAPS